MQRGNEISKPGIFFPTPRALADRMVALAQLERGNLVLEPSAGAGAIVEAILGVRQDIGLTCIEINLLLIEKLKERHFESRCMELTIMDGDFLTREPPFLFDAVIMNPPFENLADIDHVTHAWDLLRPGGRLVAIMGPGWTFREDKKAAAFRTWVDSITPLSAPWPLRAGHWEKLPEGTFKESGTMVNSILLFARKD